MEIRWLDAAAPQQLPSSSGWLICLLLIWISVASTIVKLLADYDTTTVPFIVLRGARVQNTKSQTRSLLAKSSTRRSVDVQLNAYAWCPLHAAWNFTNTELRWIRSFPLLIWEPEKKYLKELARSVPTCYIIDIWRVIELNRYTPINRSGGGGERERVQLIIIFIFTDRVMRRGIKVIQKIIMALQMERLNHSSRTCPATTSPADKYCKESKNRNKVKIPPPNDPIPTTL